MQENTIKNAPQRSSPAKAQNTGRKTRKIPKKITETYLHNSGLYYLQRYASSRQNFITVMERKIKKSCYVHAEQNYDECMSLLIALADKFEKCKLLNDDQYIESVIQSLRRRGYSRTGLLKKLAQKGIKNDIALAKILAHENEQNSDISIELESARKFAQRKKIGPYAKENNSTTPEKNFAKFARAGYSYDIARKILAMDLEDTNQTFT